METHLSKINYQLESIHGWSAIMMSDSHMNSTDSANAI